MDPAKLKVVELRAELAKRRLDTKGVKAILVERLLKALQDEAEVDTQQPQQFTAEESSSNEEVAEVAVEDENSENEQQQSPRASRSSRGSTAGSPVKTPTRGSMRSSPSKPQEQTCEATEPEEPEEPEPEPEEPQPQQQQQQQQKSPEREVVEEKPVEVPQQESSTSSFDSDVVKETEAIAQEDIEQKCDLSNDQPDESSESEESKSVSEASTYPAGGEDAAIERDDDETNAIKEEDLKQEPESEKLSETPQADDLASKSDEHETKPSEIIKDEPMRGEQEYNERKRKRSPSPQEDSKPSAEEQQQQQPREDEPELDTSRVSLSWYDSDLNLTINKNDLLSATPMSADGFCYMWAGARASYGFASGKLYFETKVTDLCQINAPEEEYPHVLRVGWSAMHTSMQLGEDKLSYGYGGTGKKSSGNKFLDYGPQFGKDDVVGSYLDLSDPGKAVISFTLNGRDLGVAYDVPSSELEDKPLFPHVLSKNSSFVCNFGQEEPWAQVVMDGYSPVGSVELKDRVPGPQRPEQREDCEMIMMCGLPGAGKTHWATRYAEENPEKMYNVLGTNNLIDKMKVMGLPRKRNYSGRWEVLIDKCTRALNKLLELASKRRRNYILDQTNVYPTAQRRKMKHFAGFRRKAVVIVPTEEEFKSRVDKREAVEGKEVPDNAVLEMKANFAAPTVGELFDEIEYVELAEDEAKKVIEKFNKEGKDAGYGQSQGSKRPRMDRSDPPKDGHAHQHRHHSGGGGGNRDNRDRDRDSRDHRRQNYPDRNRPGVWRGGGNPGGWRDRPRGGGGHMGYGMQPWRGRGAPGGGRPPQHRGNNDRRNMGNDRNRNDRNRPSSSSRSGTWGGYQSSQSSPGSWQQGNWSSGQSGQGGWGQQGGGWNQGQQQQWGGTWKGYGQGGYNQMGSGYSQQGYGNGGNWNNSNWNPQYYNQYGNWSQQQQQQQTPSSQTTAANSQATETYGSTPSSAQDSTAASTYDYSQNWQGYSSDSYNYPAQSESQTNHQHHK